MTNRAATFVGEIDLIFNVGNILVRCMLSTVGVLKWFVSIEEVL